MKRYLNIILMITCLVLTACDFKYRYSDSGADPQEVEELFNNVVNTNSALSTYASTLNDLYNDPNTYLYFAQWENGYEPMGPLEAVVPIDWEYITGQTGLSASQITMARIFYLHKIYEDGTSDDVLVLEYAVSGSDQTPLYFSNVGKTGDEGYVDGNTFSTIVSSSSGLKLKLESYDVVEDDLDVNIQLRIYADDETFLGKFSNLEGFSI